MTNLRFAFPCGLLLLGAALTLACGLNHDRFRSLTVSPASADAQDYTNGQVQFTASGTLINGTQVKPVAAMWTVGPPWLPSSAVPLSGIQLDQTGLASCGSAASGISMIVATAPADPHFPVSKMSPSTPQVMAAATLTCP